ncbi:hypothetical protein [Geothrix sp. SG200]|uniref:hypothetical protein n=1 Tax=Geothrix sp. SG200 TaxID=2922865 RepID=UPI001FABE1FF|nr:hypothetical protein [Geothrix sp. SG200]
MITKLIGAATLFAAGSLVAGAPATLGAASVEPFGADAALSTAAGCGAKDAKDAGKAPAKDAKAKEGSCGKGSCGSKDAKAKKGSKDGSCGKGSCGSKDPKKDAPADKK